MSGSRDYPDHPFLAVSAAILRGGQLLIVRRKKKPAQGLFTLPGGVAETGESLIEAVTREVREETGLAVEPFRLLGYREAIGRDDTGRVKRHFVILPFAARFVSGELRLNNELTEARWIGPSGLAGLETTEGLDEIVAAAFATASQS